MGREKPQSLEIRELGPIRHAELEFGDLTVLVGPQATGKTIALETLKFAVDIVPVVKTLRAYGYDLSRGEDFERHVSLLYGEGLGGIWGEGSRVRVDGEDWSLRERIEEAWSHRGKTKPRVFYVPAHRVLSFDSGWPRSFQAFGGIPPFVLRDFSEEMRRMLEAGLGRGGAIFPEDRRLRQPLRDSVDRALFHGASVEVDRSELRRRLVIRVGEQRLHELSWSAGQREFLPLLLGLYKLLPTQGSTRRQDYRWAVLEEPEMGLHPRAIEVVVLLAFELLARGYRVALSTHSVEVVEILWAIRLLREAGRLVEGLQAIFEIKNRNDAEKLVRGLDRGKGGGDIRLYYFEPLPGGGARSREISSLDAFAEDEGTQEWGGLVTLSSRIEQVLDELGGEE